MGRRNKQTHGGDFNTPPLINETSRHKISKNRQKWMKNINHLDFIIFMKHSSQQEQNMHSFKMHKQHSLRKTIFNEYKTNLEVTTKKTKQKTNLDEFY